MKTYGLIGFPIGHSFSSSYFSKKFKNENIDAEYLNYSIEDIASIKDILKNSDSLAGLNVTIPHKKKVLPYLDDIDKDAKEIGAVNVVKLTKLAEGYSLKGYNSDVIGFERSFKPFLKKQHTHALVLGTGGASKAIIYVLSKLGIKYKYVSRNASNGILSYEDLDKETMQTYKVIINCTPLGMHPKTNHCPNIPYQYISEEHYLYDLIYNPEISLFLEQGKNNGAAIKNGLEMLHIQADAAWDIWNS